MLLLFVMFIHATLLIRQQRISMSAFVKLKLVPRNESHKMRGSQTSKSISLSLRSLVSALGGRSQQPQRPRVSSQAMDELSSERSESVVNHSTVSFHEQLVESFKDAMSGEEMDKLRELTQVFVQMVTSHNLTYFMYGGTLIGSWRHHGIIPWDDDVDLILNAREKTRLKVMFF